MATIKIKYTQAVAPEVSKVDTICPIFDMDGSGYTHNPAYADTVYAAAEKGWKQWDSLDQVFDQMTTHPSALAMFYAARANEGQEIKFEETDAGKIAYIMSLKDYMAEHGFELTVTDGAEEKQN